MNPGPRSADEISVIYGRLLGLRMQGRSFAGFNVYIAVFCLYTADFLTFFYRCIMSYFSFMYFNWYILHYLERTLFGTVLQRYMSSEAVIYVTFYHKDEFEVEFIYLIRLCLWDFLIFVYSGFRIKQYLYI